MSWGWIMTCLSSFKLSCIYFLVCVSGSFISVLLVICQRPKSVAHQQGSLGMVFGLAVEMSTCRTRGPGFNAWRLLLIVISWGCWALEAAVRWGSCHPCGRLRLHFHLGCDLVQPLRVYEEVASTWEFSPSVCFWKEKNKETSVFSLSPPLTENCLNFLGD